MFKVMSHLRDETGQTTSEYVLLLSAIATMSIGLAELSDEIKTILDQSTTIFRQISENLQSVSAQLAEILSR